MEKSVDRDEMIAYSRRLLLQPCRVRSTRRDRWFSARLLEREPLRITPDRFLEVYDSTVKPIVLAASHCRLSVSAEHFRSSNTSRLVRRIRIGPGPHGAC